MKKIESFNSGLNSSSLKNTISYTSFKDEVSKIIEQEIMNLKNTIKSCVIGAGNLNDINVDLFAESFNFVNLTDIDLGSIKNALDFLKKDGKNYSNVSITRIEYTGFEKNLFFARFKENIIKLKSNDEIEKYLRKSLSNLENYKFLKNDDNEFDLIYVSPIYTQLVYNELLYELSVLRGSGYPEHNIKFIEDFLIDEMINIIDRFNNNIVRVLNDNGVLVVSSDIFQGDNESDFMKNIINNIDKYEYVENVYEKYVEDYGVGLGDFGLLNLDEKLNVISSKWVVWPFDEKNSFAVKIKVYKK
ncbi:hypothetical protein CI105_02920 [Candidatus Izimaplasma bacterium ZiA1]|uniref:hypothetical protein n=1 Tax=Candidatus Izimoplasma sp. ZiA1 TaxID=2024899 RepID=UPI000BAA6354|nr:hypothetical protein CI105_02920 [Candidatus Izimaplasma bacterium ZiA1]